MKQTILFLAILVALTGTSLTSCKQSTKQQKREAFKQMVGYNMYFSRDLIDVADIVVTYTDSTGLDATDTLTFDKIDEPCPTAVGNAGTYTQIPTHRYLRG